MHIYVLCSGSLEHQGHLRCPGAGASLLFLPMMSRNNTEAKETNKHIYTSCMLACREEEEEADFLMRVSGTLRLLGALWVNHDIARAWAFVTAMLNAVPANRTSASALLAFLQTAGNALCHTYGRQVQLLFFCFVLGILELF